jgi:hypothetical protein
MSRIRRVLKWMGVALVVLASTLLLANAWYVSSASRRLEEKLARLSAANQPLSLLDLGRLAIPEDQNARAQLQQVAAEVAELRKQLSDLSPNQAQPSLDDPTQRDAVTQLFSEHEPLFVVFNRAASCPDYVPALRTDVPHTQFLEQLLTETAESREVSRLLTLRVNWLLAEGRRDEALESTLTQLKLARHLRRNPLIVWHLVTIACQYSALDSVNRWLSSGDATDAQRKLLDDELALHDSREGHRWALESERASALTALREMPGFDFWLSRGFACEGASHLIELFDEHLAIVDQPYTQVATRKPPGRPASRHANTYRVVVELLRPALDVAREPTERVIAYSRAVRVLNSLQGKGNAAALPSLEHLGLPASAIQDPYSSESLLVKRVDGGWRVYSVGKNGRDDGGLIENLADICAGQ